MIKHRIKKLEEKLQVGKKAIKIWPAKFGQEEEQIADIKTEKVKHPDGSIYSENDINFFIDFEMFMPKSQAEDLKKKRREQNAQKKT